MPVLTRRRKQLVPLPHVQYKVHQNTPHFDIGFIVEATHSAAPFMADFGQTTSGPGQSLAWVLPVPPPRQLWRAWGSQVTGSEEATDVPTTW